MIGLSENANPVSMVETKANAENVVVFHFAFIKDISIRVSTVVDQVADISFSFDSTPLFISIIDRVSYRSM